MANEEPVFKTPPLWIHASEAGKWMLSRREAKRRAVLEILERLAPAKPPSSPRPSAGRRPPRPPQS